MRFGKFIFLLSTMALLANAGTDIMFCGSTQRSGADLYLADGTYTESSGCNPDVAVQQAMLVSRSGTIGGNGAAWLAYLNAGGIIVTEWSISEDVYNEIYGTAVAEGASYGSCGDNAMPDTKLNPTHAFWVTNASLTETSTGATSCGRSIDPLMTADPSIVPLGSSNGTTYFGYKSQGSGHLYLLDADWQDSEAGYTDDSRHFMGALIDSTWVSAPIPVAVPLFGGFGSLLLVSLFGLFGYRRLKS